MTYPIIQPPFTLKFREMSRKELKDYFRWFMEVIPDRIRELTAAVHETPGFQLWLADKTPSSLEMLGEWFASQVDVRPRTQEEIQEIKGRLSFPIEISGTELTNKTFSLAMDIGMYVSQVFLHNHPVLHWDQEFGSKRYVDYGQPVLAPFTPAPFNPVRMMVTLAYGFADKSRTGRRLHEIYENWSKKVQAES